jgi:hypothetical protein
MSARMIERRDFLWLTLGLAGGAVAGSMPAAATLVEASASEPSRMLFVYDGSAADAVRWVSKSKLAPADARPLAGDRVRFAHALLATAPQTIGGLTRHVDLLVIAGAAEEAGYRLIEQSRYRNPSSGGPYPARGGPVPLVAWRMQLRHGSRAAGSNGENST